MESIKLKLPGMDDYFTQEAYKVLRTNLQFCGQDVRVIMITSCHENEGKSTVSLSIANSFAELGKRVLVIDADMRKSVIAGRNTTARNPSGLSEVLTGMCPAQEALCRVENTNMYILFAGVYPPNPVELLNGKLFSMLIAESRKNFDYIFIDTPPLGRVIDAAVVAPHCDGAVLLLGSQKIHRNQAQEIVSQIEKSGCKMLGIVRKATKKTSKAYYGKNHNRYY